MKRILRLAYLLVWTWYWHRRAAELSGENPSTEIILLVDEVEAHLHPQWQRSLLPALLTVADRLGEANTNVQILATTHAPLVLASVEPVFDPATDKVFLLEQEQRKVELKSMLWRARGEASRWLTSELFGLKQARSQEGEQAIDTSFFFERARSELALPPPRLVGELPVESDRSASKGGAPDDAAG